jgi:hypothetical protein
MGLCWCLKQIITPFRFIERFHERFLVLLKEEEEEEEEEKQR